MHCLTIIVTIKKLMTSILHVFYIDEKLVLYLDLY